jgi:Xaa-Pro aminopeptidase
MKSGVEGVPKLEDWLMAVLPAGSRVAIDPRITSIASYKALKTAFKDRLSIVFVERNLVDEVWTDRPAYSTNPLMVTTHAHASFFCK